MTKQTEKEILLTELYPFKEHPYKVEDNEEMDMLCESIRENGVLMPITVRERDSGGYEIVSGHRRYNACKRLGMKSVNCSVYEMTNEEAVIAMIDANLHRERILPSEKAFAYKMKMDVLRKQGKRTDLTSSHNGPTLRSDEQIAKENGESRATVQRYIRLTRLIPELLELVDEGRIAISIGAEIAGFGEDIQWTIWDTYDSTDITPNLSQAVRMRNLNNVGALDEYIVRQILAEEKANQIEKISFKCNDIQRYFPKNYTQKQMNDTIIKLLSDWKRKREEQCR